MMLYSNENILIYAFARKSIFIINHVTKLSCLILFLLTCRRINEAISHLKRILYQLLLLREKEWSIWLDFAPDYVCNT